MEARETIGVRGIVKRVSRVDRAVTRSQPEDLDRLVGDVRRHLDVVLGPGGCELAGRRSESALGVVMARVRDRRRRGAWRRGGWIVGTFRALVAMGSMVWSSRAVRLLVP